MKKPLLLILLSVAALTFSSCNTFIGMGRDFQTLGNGMQNTGHGKTWDGKAKPAAQPAYQPAPVR